MRRILPIRIKGDTDASKGINSQEVYEYIGLQPNGASDLHPYWLCIQLLCIYENITNYKM